MLVATPILVGLGRPDRGRCAHRPVRWPRHVHRGVAGVDRAGAAVGVAGCRRFLRRCCWCSGSSWASRARSSRSVSRSPTTGTSRPDAVSRPAFSALGMVGTALSAFFTPRFVSWFGLVRRARHHRRRAGADRALVCMRGDAQRARLHPNTDPVLPKLRAAAKLAVTWEMSFLYAVVFGGFVAFSQLPADLSSRRSTTSRWSTPAPAPPAFAMAAVIARPIGGMLSDRIQPKYRGAGLVRRAPP